VNGAATRTTEDLIEDTTEPVDQALGLQGVPRAEEHPTLRLWPEVGQWLGLSRTATYEAAARGQIETLKFGRRTVVPTAGFRRMLGLD
jgi:hypothetical protein